MRTGPEFDARHRPAGKARCQEKSGKENPAPMSLPWERGRRIFAKIPSSRLQPNLKGKSPIHRGVRQDAPDPFQVCSGGLGRRPSPLLTAPRLGTTAPSHRLGDPVVEHMLTLKPNITPIIQGVPGEERSQANSALTNASY